MNFKSLKSKKKDYRGEKDGSFSLVLSETPSSRI